MCWSESDRKLLAWEELPLVNSYHISGNDLTPCLAQVVN